MGHLDLYNRNQIRDKTLTGSYFFEYEVAKWRGYGIGLGKQYYMQKNVVNVVSHADIMRFAKEMEHWNSGGAYGNGFFILHNGL